MNSQTFNLHQIFWGNTSPGLLAEIAFRTIITYVYALILLRFISRRGFGTLSLFEIIIIVALGSAVGDPMINPDMPLIRGFVVITIVILVMRATVFIVSKSSRAENVIEGTAGRIVYDRLLDRDGMKKLAIRVKR